MKCLAKTRYYFVYFDTDEDSQLMLINKWVKLTLSEKWLKS